MKFKICKWLVLLNILFWLAIAVGYSMQSKNATGSVHAIVSMLLFLEPILFLILYAGISRRIKIFYVFGLVLTLSNIVLSITDEMGLYDFFSLALSSITFVSLLISKPLKA